MKIYAPSKIAELLWYVYPYIVIRYRMKIYTEFNLETRSTFVDSTKPRSNRILLLLDKTNIKNISKIGFLNLSY